MPRLRSNHLCYTAIGEKHILPSVMKMKKHDIAVLACKILGLYALITGGVPALCFVLTRTPDMWRIDIVTQLVRAVLMIGIACVLWSRAESIARRMFSSEEAESSSALSISPKELQTVSFSVVGLVTVALTLPWAVADVVFYQTRPGGEPRVPLAELVKLVIGFYLLFRARRLSDLVSSIRDEDAQPEE